MRSRGYVWLLIALGSTLLFPSTVVADTIRITGGFLEMSTPASPFNLVGDRRGFRLFGSHYLGAVGVGTYLDCPVVCGPGEVAHLAHAASGSDLPATATLDGTLYEDVGSLDSRANAVIGFAGSFTLPPFATTAVLHTPFMMEGTFSNGFEVLTLLGSGIATSNWRTETIPSGELKWSLMTIRYDFFGAAPVPEPTTLVLAGVAGAAAAFARRRRRAH
jgi:hypothetical protein